MVFHMAAIAGVAKLWKPVATIDEPMEITMVDVDKTVPSPAPTVKPAPKALAVKPDPKIVTPQPQKVVPIVKTPAKVNLQPKPAPKAVIPALDTPIPIVKTTASLTTNPAAKPNRPIRKSSLKPVSSVKTTTPTKPAVAPAFPDELFRSTLQPARTNKAPRPQQTASQPKIGNDDRVSSSSDNQSGLVGTPSGGGGGLAGKLSNNPNPGGSGGNAGNGGDFGAVTPSKIGVSGGDGIGSANNQSGLAGNSSDGGRLARGSGGSGEILTNAGGDGEFGTVAPSKIGASGGDGIGSANNQSGLAGNSSGGGKLTRGFGGGDGGGNGIGGGGGDGDFGTVTQGNTARTARKGVGNEGNPRPSSSGDNDGDGGVFGLQCIKRCEISGLVDLEDRDGGKDKLRIAIAIDAKGNVTSASIAKSSGNSTIDRVVINGVKQMQFSPPGKVVRRVVKANILL